jgi:hypothetical protein
MSKMMLCNISVRVSEHTALWDKSRDRVNVKI